MKRPSPRIICIVAGAIVFGHAESVLLANTKMAPDAKFPPRAALTLASTASNAGGSGFAGVDTTLGVNLTGPKHTVPLKHDGLTAPST